MKFFFRWFFLTCKRLYRSFAFWGVIFFMLVIGVTFSYVSKTEPAVARILLVQQNPEDSVSKKIITLLMDSRETISFVMEDDAHKAQEQVLYGKADAVWVFPDDMSDVLQSFSENIEPQSKILIFQREDTVILRLARERLSAAVYQCGTRYVYLRFLQEKVPGSQNVSNEELLKYWHETSVSGALFTFTDIDGTQNTSDNTILQPFWGLLAILGTMLSVIISLRFQKDLDSVKLTTISRNKRILVEFCYQLAAGLHYGFAMLILACISNRLAFGIKEVICVLTFVFSTSAFGMLIRSIMGGRRLLLAFMPALVVILMLFCPVFVSFRYQVIFKWLLPPTYYLISLHDISMVIYGVIYGLLAIALTVTIRFIRSCFLSMVSH